MAEPQLLQDSKFEERKDTIDFDDFKIQDIKWPSEFKKSGSGDWIDKIVVEHPFVFEGHELVLEMTKRYDHDDSAEHHDEYCIDVKVKSLDAKSFMYISARFYSDSDIYTVINKVDKTKPKSLPQKLGKEMYNKLFSLFQDFVKTESPFKKFKGSEPGYFTHNIHRAPDVSIEKTKLSEKGWYKIFGSYLTKYRYEYTSYNWVRDFEVAQDFREMQFVDYDWNQEDDYTDKKTGLMVTPYRMNEEVSVEGQAHDLQGMRRDYFSRSGENMQLEKQSYQFHFVEDDKRIALLVAVQGGKVNSSVIIKDPDKEMSEVIPELLQKKLSHFLTYKAIEDEQEYEHDGKVYKAGEKAEKKLVKEYLEGQGVKLPKDELTK